jgi:PKD repeat protein
MCLPAIPLFANIGVASATNYMPQGCYSFTIDSAPDTPVSNPKGPYTCTEGVPLTVNGSGPYGPDGSIVAYIWDFDNDGETDSTQQNPTHKYAEGGVYTVGLTVYESDGGGATMRKEDYIEVLRMKMKMNP